MKSIKQMTRLLGNHRGYSFSQALYSSNIVNKLIITRSQSNRYSLYIDTELTIKQFMAKLKEIFPTQSIGLTTSSGSVLEIGKSVDTKKEEEELKNVGDIPVTEALLLNRLMVYEKDEKNAMQLIYGVEISQLNFTNKINIPQHIEEGVLQMNNYLTDSKLTVGNAFSFANIKNNGHASDNKLSKQEQTALSQSITQLIKIKNFNQQVGPYLPTTNKLMTRIITFLSVNWVFLFYLTYGRYGWDVGQPVSYLTGLAVDLMAMIGLFEANSALISQREKDKQLIETIINMRANERMAKWRIAYLCRKVA